MATSENPFPPEKLARKQKSGNSYYSGMGSSAKQPMTPLYYEETINASISRNDEMSFESQEQKSQSERSGNTCSSHTTFRDTQIDELQKDHLMHVQNLSSIINNPKRKGLF